VDSVNADWRTAPLNEKQRAMLGFIEKLTLSPNEIHSSDVTPLRAIGISEQAIEDAIAVCAVFSIITRIADTLGFDVPGPASFSKSAQMLLKRGYM
jgi:uncharacterized peroxidase-related enzyme